MKISKTAEYSWSGSSINVDQLSDIVETARAMKATLIDIDQTRYNEPPYGTSVYTTITIEQSKPETDRTGY